MTRGKKAAAAPRTKDRILWNDRATGDIDEIVLENVTVHVEQMHGRCWWIGIHGDDGRHWSGNFVCDGDGRMTFTQQDSDVEWADDCEHPKEQR